MPPIARLTPDQAIYHFISGYTSKIAGTEIGLGVEPEITFSTCFGGPFMVHNPLIYAELLKKKIQKHDANVWLVNTGWTGGPFGVGKRISIHHTRALLNAALNGSLLRVKYKKDPVFGFDVPEQCEGVSPQILVRRARGALHREFQIDDVGMPRTYLGGGPEAAYNVNGLKLSEIPQFPKR